VSVKVKNISPFGHLDVPLVGRVVEAGEVFDATEDQASQLLAQPTHYAPADTAAEAFLAALTAPETNDGDEPQAEAAPAPPAEQTAHEGQEWETDGGAPASDENGEADK
jgi:hypothetical protein